MAERTFATVIGAILAAATVGCSSAAVDGAAPPPDTPLNVGETGRYSTGTVTLQSFDVRPVQAGAAPSTSGGEGLAVAEVEVCPAGALQVSGTNFTLRGSGGSSAGPETDPAVTSSPDLAVLLRTAAPGQCTKGFLTFPVGPAVAPQRLVFTGPGASDDVVWQL